MQARALVELGMKPGKQLHSNPSVLSSQDVNGPHGPHWESLYNVQVSSVGITPVQFLKSPLVHSFFAGNNSVECCQKKISLLQVFCAI